MAKSYIFIAYQKKGRAKPTGADSWLNSLAKLSEQHKDTHSLSVNVTPTLSRPVENFRNCIV